MLDVILFLIQFLSEELRVKSLLILRTLGFKVMAQTRTAKGTNSSKASGSSLSVNNVEIQGGSTIVVGIAFDNSQGNPEIKWGNKKLKRDITIENSNDIGFRAQIYRGYVRTTRTRDLVATWGAAILARSMFVTEITEASFVDVFKDKAENATTDPDTGVAPTSTDPNTLSIAAFGSNGPVEDSAGTVGSGHTVGQRDGTTGGAANTNITIQETYEFLTTATTIKSQFTGATSSDWASCIIAYKATQTFTVSRAEYQPFDGHPTMESVVFTLKDESGVDKFQSVISREEFENLTDSEVSERLKNDSVWWAAKEFDEAPSPDFTADSTFNTRVSSFVNDDIIV